MRINGSGETLLDALKDVVARRLVTRQTESTVASVVTGDLVQVPKVALELLGLDVGNSLLGSEGLVGIGTNGQEAGSEGGDGLHGCETSI